MAFIAEMTEERQKEIFPCLINEEVPCIVICKGHPCPEVLKNIADFIERIQNQENYKYGKALEFVHSEKSFTDDALKQIDFHKHTTFPGKKEKHEDIYKVLAFQFSQCMFQTHSVFLRVVLGVSPLLIRRCRILAPYDLWSKCIFLPPFHQNS